MLRPLMTAGLAALSLGLSGCGFTPLYAAGEGDAAVTQGLRSIEIARIVADPDIQRLVDRELRDLLPEPDAGGAEYRLVISLKDIRQAVALRQAESSSRFDYYLRGDYELIDARTGDRLHRQRIESQTSYGIVSEQYASMVGREDAARRAAAEIARRIEVDLALYFAGRAPEQNDVTLPDILDVETGFETNAEQDGEE